MSLDKFWLQSNNSKQIDLQNLKELKKSDLGNNNALIQLFNIFDTQKADGTVGSDGVLNKSELTSLFNTFNAGANSSKGASKSVFELNEAEEYLNTTKTTSDKTLSEIGVKAADLFEFLSKLTQNSNATVNVNNVANDVHLTEEQAQDEVISTISDDTANARTLLMKQDNGHISQLYNKAKELFDSDLSLSNVEEAFMLQEECLENLSKAKEGKLSKREYFLQNREHLKTMMKRRLFRKDENTGLDFLDNNRGKMSKQEFAKFMEDYINQKINEIDKLDSLNKFQHDLLTLTSSGVNRMLKNYQKAAENKLFIAEAKSVHSKTSSIPQKYNTTEPMTFKEVFKIERNQEYSKDRVEAYISQKQKTDFAVGAYNKYQSFKMNSSEILNDYTKSVAGTYAFGGMAAGDQPNPEKQMQKVLEAFESYYANPIDPNSARNEIETLIKDNKLPISVIQDSDGKLSLDLSNLKTDTEKNNVLNKLLKLEDSKLEAKLKTTLGGEVDEMLEMLSNNTQIAFTNAYGHDFTNELVQEMSDDNKTVIQRYTGNASQIGMGLTVVGGILCFTPLAGVGAAMVGIGNAMAIGGMVAESALGFEEALSRSNLNPEELKELSKTLVMNAGGFVVGYKAGQTGMKAFNKLIDKKLAEVFKTEMANGNRAEALKQVFSNPEYLKNFMQAAGVKLSADFVISYAGDLAMMGILDTNDDWKSLLQSNLIGIMTSMGGDLKDVANLGIKGNKAKSIQPEEKTNNKVQELTDLRNDTELKNTEDKSSITVEKAEHSKVNDTPQPDSQTKELQENSNVRADEVKAETTKDNTAEVKEKTAQENASVNITSQELITTYDNVIQALQASNSARETVDMNGNKVIIYHKNALNLGDYSFARFDKEGKLVEQGEIAPDNVKETFGKTAEEFSKIKQDGTMMMSLDFGILENIAKTLKLNWDVSKFRKAAKNEVTKTETKQQDTIAPSMVDVKDTNFTPVKLKSLSDVEFSQLKTSILDKISQKPELYDFKPEYLNKFNIQLIDRILSSDILPDNIVSSVNYMCSINVVKVVNELYNIVEQNANNYKKSGNLSKIINLIKLARSDNEAEIIKYLISNDKILNNLDILNNASLIIDGTKNAEDLNLNKKLIDSFIHMNLDIDIQTIFDSRFSSIETKGAQVAFLEKVENTNFLNRYPNLQYSLADVVYNTYSFKYAEGKIRLIDEIITNEKLNKNNFVESNITKILRASNSSASVDILIKIISDNKLSQNKELMNNVGNYMRLAAIYGTERISKILENKEFYENSNINFTEPMHNIKTNTTEFKCKDGSKITFDRNGNFVNIKKNVIQDSAETEHIETQNSKIDYVTNWTKHDGFRQLVDSSKKIYDENGKLLYEEVYELSNEVDNKYNIYRIEPNGQKYAIGLAEKTPSGEIVIEKTLVSNFGDKTQYVYIESPSGERIIRTVIRDNTGKILCDNNFKYKQIDENHFETTENGITYDIKYFEDKVVVIKNGNESAEIKIGDNAKGTDGVLSKEILPLLKHLAGSTLFSISKYGLNKIGKNINNVTAKNAHYSYENNLVSLSDELSNELAILTHELGHYIDFQTNMHDNKELISIYDKEKFNFYRMGSNSEQVEMLYITDVRNDPLGREYGGINELIADTYSLLNSNNTTSLIELRREYIQQYFPKTFAKIAELMQAEKSE